MSAMKSQGKGKGKCRATGKRQQTRACSQQEERNNSRRRGMNQCHSPLNADEIVARSSSLQRETEE